MSDALLKRMQWVRGTARAVPARRTGSIRWVTPRAEQRRGRTVRAGLEGRGDGRNSDANGNRQRPLGDRPRMAPRCQQESKLSHRSSPCLSNLVLERRLKAPPCEMIALTNIEVQDSLLTGQCRGHVYRCHRVRTSPVEARMGSASGLYFPAFSPRRTAGFRALPCRVAMVRAGALLISISSIAGLVLPEFFSLTTPSPCLLRG